ncbi:EthD family reductase [Streptomyces sp. NPDC001604]|uniref:EthD family reductase n=1 Tax=Streptomyces sp. NPDC001604 TaxID=3364593 RepID=UPI0036A01C08
MTARFLVLYGAPPDPAAFDRHYREVHLPLARKLPGLRRYTLGREVTAVRGGEPPHLVADLEWDTAEELRAAFASPEGRACAEDAERLQRLATVRSMVFTVDEA